MEMAPVAPGRLFERVGFGVGDAAPALDRLELLQGLLFADRAFCRVDRCRLLRRGGRRRQRQREQRQGAENAAKCRYQRLHPDPFPSSLSLSVIPAEAGIHPQATRTAEPWIPAFAGMTRTLL